MFSGINILDFRGSSIPRQTIEAYLATDYSIWGSRRLILRVGQRNHELAALYQKYAVSTAAVLTAWNPYSEARSDAENETAQRDLISEIDRLSLRHEPGHGADPTGKWPPGVLCITRAGDCGGSKRSRARQGNKWIDVGDNIWVPLYEAKMIHQFDHRWGTYDSAGSSDVSQLEKADPWFEVTSRYWLPKHRVQERLQTKGWPREWLLGWRDITNATNERTVIATGYPSFAIAHTIRNMFVLDKPPLATAFIANLSSLTLDYVARQKLGGTHLTVEMLKQLPTLPPSFYTLTDLAFIVSRVLELTYTSHSMAPFARDLGYDGPPFAWNEDRRAQLRAQLDAWYARAYGLTRDELRYILDPADVKGPNYPSETFRVLKTNEIRRFGEYRTARLVLQAWDRMERGELAA
jgi:hypothetical protein